MTSSSAIASDFLFGSAANSSSHPPNYNDVIKMCDLPSAQLLLEQTSIFGTATTVYFEWNSSDVDGTTFLIRDADGSLQAKGDERNYNATVETTVRSVNGIELLKITEQDVDETNGEIVRTFGVYHRNAFIGTVKAAAGSQPSSSLQIFYRNPSRPQIIVNSLKIGDYAIFRQNLTSIPLCNLQMPDVEIYNSREFNVKIIFHPQTGITEEEQLLCTAAAIAFKIATKKMLKIKAEEGKCTTYFGAFVCTALFVVLLVFLFFVMEKWGCERKKAQGLAGYRNKVC